MPAFVAEGLDVPQSSVPLLVEELWSDQVSIWIDRISQQFINVVACISDDTARRILKRWISYFAPEYAPNTSLYTQSYDKAWFKMSLNQCDNFEQSER